MCPSTSTQETSNRAPWTDEKNQALPSVSPSPGPSLQAWPQSLSHLKAMSGPFHVPCLRDLTGIMARLSPGQAQDGMKALLTPTLHESLSCGSQGAELLAGGQNSECLG